MTRIWYTSCAWGLKFRFLIQSLSDTWYNCLIDQIWNIILTWDMSFELQYGGQPVQQRSVSRWSDRVVRRAVGSVWRGRQVRWPLCRSIKVVRNAVHWSVQVQVPDFFPFLDGIYWITLRTYILYICTYILPFLRNSDFSPIAAIIVPLFIIYIFYYSRTYTMWLMIFCRTPFALCVFASRTKKKTVMKATIVSCPHPKNTYHFLLLLLLLFLSLSLYLSVSLSLSPGTLAKRFDQIKKM